MSSSDIHAQHPRLGSRSKQRRQANAWLVLTLSTGLLVGVLLRTFPPEAWPFYPPCPFHLWTGLLCPGCGGTRALAALAHGNFSQAIHANALVVVALAVGAAWPATAYLRALQNCRPVWPHVPVWAITAATASALIFAVARNLAQT